MNSGVPETKVKPIPIKVEMPYPDKIGKRKPYRSSDRMLAESLNNPLIESSD